MKKIASIVLNNFKNDSRVLKENISLQNAGYDVQVVALWEDGLKEFDEVQNIPVHRVQLRSKNWSKNKIIQLVKYFEYVARVTKQYKNADIFHCNDLDALLIGVVAKKFYNKSIKIVYDAHEYETEINGLKGIKKTFVKILEKYLIKYADKVITVSNAIANEYQRLYNIEKPALILNTPPYQKIEKQNIFREVFGITKEETIFLYQGGLSRGRGIEILLDTFKNLNNTKAVIVFMGYGVLENIVIKYADKYNNIYFHKAVSSDILLNYTSSADFGILFYENNCLNHYYCSPNKMFEYLMAELPVIVSNLSEMKKVTQIHNIGVVAKENSPRGLTDAIEEAVILNKEELQKNIQNIKKVYNWEEQEKILLDIYKTL